MEVRTVWDPRQDRVAFACWLGIIWVGMIGGFGLDFHRYLAQLPPPPLLVHFHAVVFFGWMVFITVQTLLVLQGKFPLHRYMGRVGMALAVLMAVLGPATALTMRARQIGLPTAHPQFLSVNFIDMADFLALLAAGLVLRRDPAAHKRLMILATVSLADPGFARLEGFFFGRPASPFAWYASVFYGNIAVMAAMALWDWRKWRRLHPAFAAGAGLILASEVAAAVLNFSPAWKEIAAALVEAWGYKGQ